MARRKPVSTRSLLPIAIWLCLLAALVYLLSYAGTLHAVDEHSALSVAESMLLGQGFHVNQMEWDQARTPPQNAFGLDGNLYSKKGIGVSLVALPLFGLGEILPGPIGAAQVALLAGSGLAVLAVWAMFWLARSLRYGLGVAALAALLLAFGSPLWPYARTLFSETPGATGLAVALLGMVAWRHHWRGQRTAPLLLAGGGLALLILVKSSNAVVVPFFGLYWLWGMWEQRGTGAWAHATPHTQSVSGRRSAVTIAVLSELVVLGTPVLLAAAATVAYNYVRFGTTFGFPLEPFETFSTPLLVGLAGLLFSPGKGIFWYFPALWLGVAFVWRWRQNGRLPDYLLAAASALALIAVYALWYDWPGGRAWGPRMIITATPALAMLALPALDWLVGVLTPQQFAGNQGHVGVPSDPHVGVRATHLRTRSPAYSRVGVWLVMVVLLLSVAVQAPGVLVNFERQEELDMQAGAAFEQLLWSPALSPLLTYWQRIGTAPDPLWLQPYLRTLPAALPALAAVVLAAAVALGLAARQIRRGMAAARPLGMAAAAIALLALLLPPLAYADPRWDEQSAVREDNRAVMGDIQAAWQSGDVVLIDLVASSDKGRRTGQWLNFARREPYIGWLRKPALNGASGEQLAAWLQPYRRAWLLLQATDEGDAASTTERWLNGWAFAGRRWWVGDQRVLEYLLPPADAGAADAGAGMMGTDAVVGPFTFDATIVLQRYWLARDEQGDTVRLALEWQAAGDADTRYSVQALGSDGTVLAQMDGRPGAMTERGDRLGLALPTGVDRLILKIYRASDGSVLPVMQPGSSAPTDYLLLTLP